MTRASIVGMARSACYWALLLSPILLLPGLCRGCNKNEYDIQEGCASCGDNTRSDVGNTHFSGYWCESGYEKTSTGCLTGKFSVCTGVMQSDSCQCQDCSAGTARTATVYPVKRAKLASTAMSARCSSANGASCTTRPSMPGHHNVRNVRTENRILLPPCWASVRPVSLESISTTTVARHVGRCMRNIATT